MTFSLTQDGSGTLSAPLTFTSDENDTDGPSAYLNINTADLANYDLDSYAMVLTATSSLADAGNASRAAVFSFTLILKSECWDSTLTPPAMPSLTYSTILYD